ncbi:rho GTPase-activating protein 6 isoform X2 [Lepus europaeus]|uniref:rho GTPase-activating protein 6 isoform X2 n=1 Tax=Lepus europaeus TaxID=9983 RepID=UPI002B49AABE|nr:rho GTPase-activating protein 6 isoform X2 [Lepus europaeus]
MLGVKWWPSWEPAAILGAERTEGSPSPLSLSLSLSRPAGRLHLAHHVRPRRAAEGRAHPEPLGAGASPAAGGGVLPAAAGGRPELPDRHPQRRPEAEVATEEAGFAGQRENPGGRRRREEPAGDPAVTPPRPRRDLSGSSSSLSSAPDTPTEAATPGSPEAPPRARRRGAVSVDSITDLDEDPSRLLEALQLSLPTAAPGRKDKARAQRLSLNPVCRQVPRLVDSCCDHLERHGLRTVGIFRVGSSKKRVRQLRAEFDRGAEVALEAERSAHDVAALLKEFLRDMAEPLLTRELYAAFIDTLLLEPGARLGALRLLVCLLPPCNCDTLRRLLHFLALVARHAQDHVGRDGREVPGNKMTSLNLATIFGPNLLHKQKSSDREFSVQSPARAEESTAVIAVVKEMIENHEALFMVPPALQNEVLLSLLETDPDVVDYLLRRKAAPPTDPPGTAPSPQASPELPDRPRQPAESGEGPHIWETGSLRPRPRPLTLDWPRRPRSLGDPDPGRAEPRPPPPYPGPREPPGGRGRQDLGAGAWLDWRRERWEIWELLSGDGPDALPETLV